MQIGKKKKRIDYKIKTQDSKENYTFDREMPNTSLHIVAKLLMSFDTLFPYCLCCK